MKTSILFLSACLVGINNICSAANNNGKPAKTGQFPFDVLIHGYTKQGKVVPCGGALISDNWVVTSGFCGDNMNYTFISTGFMDQDNETRAQNFTVTRGNIHVHPEYNRETFTNDISVMKLPSPVKTSKNIHKINLPPKSDAKPNIYENKIATATYNSKQGEDQHLTFKKVKVIPNVDCKKRFRQLNGKMFCSDDSADSGSCPGDSGSPLIINGADGKPKLIGLVFFGSFCDSKDPVVYTQVADYLDWIHQVTGIAVK